MDRITAERSTILRGLVGSTVNGLNVNDGIEDRDEMGVCIEPLEDAMALWAPFEQFIYRSAAERAGRHDARSMAGDLDLTIYSLRKWMRLALRGNPTILLLLFTPDDQTVQCDELGSELRALTRSWIPYGRFSQCIAASAEIAECEARGRVDWLRDEKDDG